MSRRTAIAWLLAPALLLLGLMTVYPLLHVLWLSFHRRILLLNVSELNGFANYTFLLGDDRFWLALRNTVYFCAVSVTLEMVLGLALALLLNSSFAGRGLVRALVLLPWAVPTVVSATMWEWIFNADFGLLNYLLGAGFNWLGSPALALNAAVTVDVWKTTPFTALLLLAALQGVPADLYRAAAVDGAGRWRVLFRITLPSIRPALLVVLVLRTLDACRVFDVVYVLTSGGPAGTTETLSLYAYRLFFQTLQFGYGSAVSVALCMLIALITLVYVALIREDER